MPSKDPEVRRRASKRYYTSAHGRAMRQASTARRKLDPVRLAQRRASLRVSSLRMRHMNFYQAVEYLGGICKDCGYKANLNALEFDHVTEPRLGGYAIGHYLAAAWPSLKAELDKCELVCANCHAIRTAQRREAA